MGSLARAVGVAALTLSVASVAHGQSTVDPVPSAQLISPERDSYLTGTVSLKATADAAAPVERVAFFVDGRQVCVIEARPFECEWDAGHEVSAHQVRVIFSLHDGSRSVRTVRTKGLGFTDTVDVDAVQVTVTVTDDDGNLVAGLPRSAFSVLEDEKPQSISYFASEDVPLELLIAVDISGSMTQAMPRLKKAVKDFLSAVPSKDAVTLLGFNDSVFALTRKSMDPAERIRAVDRLAPWGATALYDAVVRGVEMLGRQTGRKALVIFTDGEDQGSHVALEDVERRLQESDVTLYMIGQGRGVSQENLRKTMERLTAPTGGRVFTSDSIDALHVSFEELLEELSNQYLVGYVPTNTTRDDRWREIKVWVQGHRNVRARQGYRAVPQK